MPYPFPRRKCLDSSKLKEFADNNFSFDVNGRKFSEWVENTVGKGEIARHKLIVWSWSILSAMSFYDNVQSNNLGVIICVSFILMKNVSQGLKSFFSQGDQNQSVNIDHDSQYIMYSECINMYVINAMKREWWFYYIWNGYLSDSDFEKIEIYLKEIWYH